MRFLSPLLSIVLAPLMACMPLLAQAPALGSSSMDLAPDGAAALLHLRMAEGSEATTAVGTHWANGLTVEVTDAVGAPISNAAVVFRLPGSGPSAKFADGSLAAVTYSDARGRAQVKDVQWGSSAGVVAVRITAVKETMHAGLLFEENLTVASERPVARETSLIPRQMESVPQAIAVARIPAVAVDERTAQPGQLAQKPPVANSFAANSDDPDANVPTRHMLGTENNSNGETPGVSITTSGAASSGGGHGKLKWIVIAAVAAAGAGAALAFVHKGSSGSATGSSSGVSVGSPSVSVGNP